MIHTELIKNRFDSLEDYEKFAAEWTEVCCMVNQNSRNMGELVQRLAEYEDTGLDPEQVQQLKERDTAKKPIKTKGLKDFHGNIYKVVGKCPNCGCGVSNRMRFCDECGQRLDWSE